MTTRSKISINNILLLIVSTLVILLVLRNNISKKLVDEQRALLQQEIYVKSLTVNSYLKNLNARLYLSADQFNPEQIDLFNKRLKRTAIEFDLDLLSFKPGSDNALIVSNQAGSALKDLLDKDNITEGNSFTFGSISENHFSFKTTFKLKSSEEVYAFTCLISKDAFLTRMNSNNSDKNSSFFLLSKENKVHTLKKYNLDHLKDSLTQNLEKQALKSDKKRVFKELRINSSVFLIASSTLNYPKGSEIALIQVKEVKKFLEAGSEIFAVGGIVTLLVCIIAFLVSRSLVTKMNEPIHKLAETANKISLGDLTLRAEIHGNNEMSRLAQAFNSMTDSLINTYRTLATEIEDRKKAEAEYQYLANYDALTNLPNRKLFYDRLSQAILRSKRNQKSIALLIIGLDRFKNINDTFGHEVGDQLLKICAKRLQDNIRKTDTVARVGGDEFFVILEDVNTKDDATFLAEKFMEQVSKAIKIESEEVVVTASVGIAFYPKHGDTVEELVQNSDTAIHYAKGMGSCHYRVYNDQMRLRSKERLTLENALHKALERNELMVYYQPKVCLQTQKIIGSEALLRWNHPTLGFVSPGEFIPIAEETGLIIPIGFWVTEQACKQNKLWQEEGYDDLSISVNFSNRLLSHSNLEKTLIDAFEKTSLEPDSFDIEITEDIFLQDPAQVHSTLTKLTNLGASISIDDFGTGYSSFSYLKKFPISNLKIDRSFISDVTTNKDARAIVKAIIAMAKGLKVKVIAEGVETKEQLKFLESLQCEEVQGFYFSKPLPPDQFHRLIQNGIAHQF